MAAKLESVSGVVVSDERTGDSLRQFKGLVFGTVPSEVGAEVEVVVFVDNDDNGFGWPSGVQTATLKLLGDGNFGS